MSLIYRALKQTEQRSAGLAVPDAAFTPIASSTVQLGGNQSKTNQPNRIILACIGVLAVAVIGLTSMLVQRSQSKDVEGIPSPLAAAGKKPEVVNISPSTSAPTNSAPTNSLSTSSAPIERQVDKLPTMEAAVAMPAAPSALAQAPTPAPAQIRAQTQSQVQALTSVPSPAPKLAPKSVPIPATVAVALPKSTPPLATVAIPAPAAVAMSAPMTIAMQAPPTAQASVAKVNVASKTPLPIPAPVPAAAKLSAEAPASKPTETASVAPLLIAAAPAVASPAQAKDKPIAAPAPAAVSVNIQELFEVFNRALADRDTTLAQKQLALIQSNLPEFSIARMRAEAWFAQQTADMDVARRLYVRLLDKLPGDESASVNLASIERLQMRFDAAKETLAKALRNNPNSTVLRSALDQITLNVAPK